MKVNRKYDNPLMMNAVIWSKMSYCKRRKVGAIISMDTRTISTGYNGTKEGELNVCENIHNKTLHDRVIHGEANAMLYANKLGHDLTGTTLYVTTAPCIDCAKKILESGIERVVYLDIYRSRDGIDYLKDKINIERIKLTPFWLFILFKDKVVRTFNNFQLHIINIRKRVF